MEGTASRTSSNKCAFAAKIRSTLAHFHDRALGATLWSKEQEILVAVRDFSEVFIASHASSKSVTAANVALWFLYTHPNPIVATPVATGRSHRAPG